MLINPAWGKKNSGHSLGQTGWLSANSWEFFLHSISLPGFFLCLPVASLLPLAFTCSLIQSKRSSLVSGLWCSRCCLADMQTTARCRHGQTRSSSPYPQFSALSLSPMAAIGRALTNIFLPCQLLSVSEGWRQSRFAADWFGYLPWRIIRVRCFFLYLHRKWHKSWFLLIFFWIRNEAREIVSLVLLIKSSCRILDSLLYLQFTSPCGWRICPLSGSEFSESHTLVAWLDDLCLPARAIQTSHSGDASNHPNGRR